jgi:oligopeptide transport system substrate-binding protein
MQRFSTTRHQMMMLIIASLGMIALVAPVAATGPAQQPPSPGTLRVAMPEPASLDPSALSRFDDAGRDLAENLFVGLTRFDPQTRQIEPVLATDWSVSDDGLTWTVSLRDDIHWVRVDPATQTVEDVRPVVAGDFVYAVQRACDPTRPTPVTANLMIVRGCQTVANAFPGRVDALFIAREIGVRATGPYTLEIDLMFPSGYFPSLLSTPEFRPLARETIPEANTDRKSVV